MWSKCSINFCWVWMSRMEVQAKLSFTGLRLEKVPTIGAQLKPTKLYLREKIPPHLSLWLSTEREPCNALGMTIPAGAHW